MTEYEATAAGDTRRAIADGRFPITGDPQRIVAAIIASTDQQPAPLRLTLGEDAYTDVRASHVRRLTDLDSQKDVALSVVRHN